MQKRTGLQAVSTSEHGRGYGAAALCVFAPWAKKKQKKKVFTK